MNTKQKEIINKFYEAYLLGKENLKQAIYERIEELEKNTNWKRELQCDNSNIIEGYISKEKTIFCGIDNTIIFDDEEIYYLFFINLFNDNFNINGKVYPKIKSTIIITSKQYFGSWDGKKEERLYRRMDNYSTKNSQNLIRLSKFKQTGMDFCLEKALFVQNIMAILDIKTYLIYSNVKTDKYDNYERHAFNIIKFSGKTRIFDISLGLYAIYKKDKLIKEELNDTELYPNDIHRIAYGSLVKINDIGYGFGYYDNLFLRILQSRAFNTEYDNKYLNTVIGVKRNLKREEETISSNTVMAHLLLPLITFEEKLKELVAKNDGSLEKYIDEIYLKSIRGFSQEESKAMSFIVKPEIRSIKYKGKETKLVILKLPMSDRRIYKYESKYAAIVLDDKFPRYFNLTYGYPDKKIDSKECVLYEVINSIGINIEVLPNDEINTFVDAIIKEINKEDNIMEREFENTIFKDFFDFGFKSRIYKLALDIYNKKIMKPSFINNNVIKFKTKISCKECNAYLDEINEFPTTYNKNEYLGYFNSYTMNFKCEYIQNQTVCPFRVLCCIQNLLKNTNISVKYVLEKLIALQEERELKNEKV